MKPQLRGATQHADQVDAIARQTLGVIAQYQVRRRKQVEASARAPLRLETPQFHQRLA